ncbi:hypothetical protein BRADI_2g55294v3 [Brachypodium distachyon]|uniref:Uncharacterized protein n=1 Tax=Brachypodium distachyon TaxID=15368 RepID=A0A0Q3GJR4_BRADI|nr:hypothetical protein BRADI_2g55294v3 [Brachypodium distachyon]PNT73215.1 hypothetical protein BRADI_2g55294v3 [Brachypodium distachyon]PNT73216.1 hypothetical protein BRADI_2g55294v3 [Brachypodium distachyon]
MHVEQRAKDSGESNWYGDRSAGDQSQPHGWCLTAGRNRIRKAGRGCQIDGRRERAGGNRRATPKERIERPRPAGDRVEIEEAWRCIAGDFSSTASLSIGAGRGDHTD